MKAGLACSLPSVLHDYLPDGSNPDPNSQVEKQCYPSKITKSQQKPISPISASRNTTSPKSAHRRRRVDDERLEKVADLWDQVRAEGLQERHKVLHQKVLLQRALITAQDRRSDLIRLQEEEAKVKKRNDEKKRRQDTLATLQDTCRQSLADDHKSKDAPPPPVTDTLSRRNQGQRRTKQTASEQSFSLSGSVEGGSHEHAYVAASSHMKESKNENLKADKRKETDRVNATLRQHTGLYPKQGHKADRLTKSGHQSQKKVLHPLLKNHSGHLSASQIWSTLWSGSVNKLIQADQRFPKDLKETFSSHVRQGLTKFRRPVFRSFTEMEDVPDLNRLMDQSKLHQIRVLCHKTQLMYRSSQTNQDRARILLFNNPLPAISDVDDGIIQFLPPTTDTESVCSEASYLRWIKHKHWLDNKAGNDKHWSDNKAGGDKHDDEVENVCPHPARRKQHTKALTSDDSCDVSCNDSHDLLGIWHSVTSHKPRKEPKYHFLTEDEAKSTGVFLARLKLDRDKSGRHTDLLSPGQGLSLPVSMVKSARERGSSKLSFEDVPENGRECAFHGSPNLMSNAEPKWQPLSWHALSEYKEQITSEGVGDFQQGMANMWHTRSLQ